MRADREFSVARLQRVGDYLASEIVAGKVAGAVILVQQHGKAVYSRSLGVRDVVTRTPMTADTIFRIYSMSKPITSVAAMTLVDDAKLSLDDPLSKYIPAFADVKVLVDQPGANGRPATVPLQRPITIEDLLRHTSGITYGFYGDSPIRKIYAKAGLFEGDVDNAAFAERLARLPLAEQPGTLWDYGHSTDILGRVVEIVSGQSLYQFERERLLGPLGMPDTAFFLADQTQRPRVAEPLPWDWFDRPIGGIVEPIAPKRWESGGAGMIGTAGDYARFAQMLLGRGELDGHRYLKADTVALMTSDHVGSDTKIVHDKLYYPGGESGFGLGFAVRTIAKPPLPAGEYRWDGVGGTFFFIDPNDDMFVICMMQSPSQRDRIQQVVKKLVYEALE
ncbi:MAG TPA: serine hydrolase domain-containing protein [Bradyrhizobium sp.]|nr:serine hydrolase domain-containing protein [Bradyrhizobium sp.]